MKEVFTMWKSTRMIILVALSAAIYAVFLIAFKAGLVLIPGVAEVRPAAAFPIVFGLMFGPAGAWGSAIGNLIGDIFGGTLAAGSIFGFIGNFYMGYVPYKMWGALFGLVTRRDISQTTNSVRKVIAFEILALVSNAAAAVIIGWFLDFAKIVPFAYIATALLVLNFLAQCVLSPILLALLYPRVKRWGLIWTDIMRVEDVSRGAGKTLGSILMIIASLGGWIVGLLTAVGSAGQTVFGFTGESGQASVWLSVLPFMILIFVASFMLSGREQFVEEEEESQKKFATA